MEILIISLVVIILIIIWLIIMYNKFVKARNNKDNAWSNVEVELKRRYDLIPNLVDTVKGYAKHEQETLEEIISLRGKFDSSNKIEEKIAYSKELDTGLSKISVLVENYPTLKANANFLDLQAELSLTEDKISNTRTIYNSTVLEYNNKINLFPNNIVAALTGFSIGHFFEISPSEKEVPKVNFD